MIGSLTTKVRVVVYKYLGVNLIEYVIISQPVFSLLLDLLLAGLGNFLCVLHLKSFFKTFVCWVGLYRHTVGLLLSR